MKAAQLVHYGGKDAITGNDAAKPEPQANEVVIEVHAAAVNPFDIKVRDGLVRDMADMNLPATLGGDLAGVVMAVGADVSDRTVGEAVYGQANALGGKGSFAEYAPVKASQLAPKPTKLNFVEAASLPLVSCSAYQALVDHIHLQSGQKILIHGGAGGIGSIAIQLARHLGAYVATTAAGDDQELVKKLGADEVVDYKTQDFSQVIQDYDAVYDTIGGETNRNSYRTLKRGGSLVSMVEQPDEKLVEQYGVEYVAQFTQVTTERLTKIAKLIDEGALHASIDTVFPLEEAAEALEYLKTNHTHGKVVIKIKD